MRKEGVGHYLEAQKITLAYGAKPIVEELDILIDQPQIISIIGPNGAGKSTVLKAFARLLTPKKGMVLLDGKDIHRQPSKEVARTLAVLPQSTTAPMDIAVKDLVACGRTPYQGHFSSLTEADYQIIENAMERTGVLDFAHRQLVSLSGGERQRVWLAMALAQEPDILLLDEPTTFLDIHHQLDLMELVRQLHRELKITVIMVLHDLNHATRYSERVIAIKNGTIFADGKVNDVMTEANFEKLYGVKALRVNVAQDEEEYSVFVPHSVC
jgi:ABC-type cobalamin/Fe3+-siderophores transport systems, ATPase components